MDFNHFINRIGILCQHINAHHLCHCHFDHHAFTVLGYPQLLLDVLRPLKLGIAISGSHEASGDDVVEAAMPSAADEATVLKKLLWINAVMFVVELGVASVLERSNAAAWRATRGRFRSPFVPAHAAVPWRRIQTADLDRFC